MTSGQPNNPLHGITLERLLEHLVERFGGARLGQWSDIRCFQHEPSIKSSLKFLRRTPWARQQVEDLYLDLRLHEEPPTGEDPDRAEEPPK